jgi:hypothetical protein
MKVRFTFRIDITEFDKWTLESCKDLRISKLEQLTLQNSKLEIRRTFWASA